MTSVAPGCHNSVTAASSVYVCCMFIKLRRRLQEYHFTQVTAYLKHATKNKKDSARFARWNMSGRWRWWMFPYFGIVGKTHSFRRAHHHNSRATEQSHRDSILSEGTPLFILPSSAGYQTKWVSVSVYFLSLSGVMFRGLCCLCDSMCFC